MSLYHVNPQNSITLVLISSDKPVEYMKCSPCHDPFYFDRDLCDRGLLIHRNRGLSGFASNYSHGAKNYNREKGPTVCIILPAIHHPQLLCDRSHTMMLQRLKIPLHPLNHRAFPICSWEFYLIILHFSQDLS